MADSEIVSGFNNSTASLPPLQNIDETSRAPRIAFLTVFIAVSFFGNVCVMIVILPNKKYRRVPINVIILNMAALNVFDSLVNMPLVFGSLASTDWIFTKQLCQVNTFSMSLVIVETVLTVFVLIIDRFIAIRATSSQYKKFTGCTKLIFIIIFTWVQSVGFSMPFLVGAVPSSFQAELNLCTISDPSSLLFICFTSVFCFLFPTIIIIILAILMVRYAYKKRTVVRAKLAEHNYSTMNTEQPQLLKEISMAKYAGILFVMWFLFECPYIVTTYIKQFQYSKEIKDNPGITALEYSWLVDVTFLFVRFAFASVLPILTFLWRKDFWQAWKDMILCRRSNSVTDVDTLSAAVITSSIEKKQIDDHSLDVPSLRSKERTKVENSSALSFNIPVLFATSNGIHVETNESDIFYTDMDTSRLDVKGKKLDVVSAVEYVPPDTSDYDSESDVDQYSVSQPISSVQTEERVMGESIRSVSQPQVQSFDKKPQKKDQFKSENIASSCWTDSGLDLTGTHRSSEMNSLDSSIIVNSTYKICDGNCTCGFEDQQTGMCQIDKDSITKHDDNDSQDSVVGFVNEDCSLEPSRDTYSKCYLKSLVFSNNTEPAQNDDSSVSDQHTATNKTKELLSEDDTGLVNSSFPVHDHKTENFLEENEALGQENNLVLKPPLKLNPLMNVETKIVTKTDPYLDSTNIDYRIPGENSDQGMAAKHSVLAFGATFTQQDKSSTSKLENQQMADSQNVSRKKNKKKNAKKQKKHKRQHTSDSQKALLGSGSSSELHDLKSALGGNTQNTDTHPSLDSLFQSDNPDPVNSSVGITSVTGNTTDVFEWKSHTSDDVIADKK